MDEATHGPLGSPAIANRRGTSEERYGYPHPLQERDLYTPVTTDVMDLLYRIRVREGSWRGVARVLGMRVQEARGCRELRKLRSGKVKALSMTVLDRMLTHAGIGLTVADFTWFTAEDLVALGIWEPNQDLRKYRDRVRKDTKIDTTT